MIALLQILGWAKPIIDRTADRDGRAVYVLHPALAPWKKTVARTIVRTFG